MESTSKYFQSSCSVFHLFLYHSEILPSLTWITTIDSQLLSLLLFLPHPNHYPNLRSKQNDIPKVPLKLHHCLFNNSLRWLSEKKQKQILTRVFPRPHLLLSSLSPSPIAPSWPLEVLCVCWAGPLFSFASLMLSVSSLLSLRNWPPYGFLSQNRILPYRILIIICKSILFF